MGGHFCVLRHPRYAVHCEDFAANTVILLAQLAIDKECIDERPEAQAAKGQGHADGVADIPEVVAVAAESANEEPQQPSDSGVLFAIFILHLCALYRHLLCLLIHGLHGLHWLVLLVWVGHSVVLSGDLGDFKFCDLGRGCGRDLGCQLFVLVNPEFE